MGAGKARGKGVGKGRRGRVGKWQQGAFVFYVSKALVVQSSGNNVTRYQNRTSTPTSTINTNTAINNKAGKHKARVPSTHHHHQPQSPGKVMGHSEA